MALDIYNLLNKISFTRVSGSEEELKCATLLKEQIENLGVNAQIIPFEVQDYNVTKACLKNEDKTYEVSGIKVVEQTPLQLHFIIWKQQQILINMK